MYDEASLARNTAGPAISAGRPQRPIGTFAIVDRPPSGPSHRFRFRSVAVQPGHSAFTRIPDAAHSTARVLVTDMTAALEAPYGLRPGHAGDRRDVDHRAAAALAHMRPGRLADVDRRVQVQPHDILPAGDAHVQER